MWDGYFYIEGVEFSTLRVGNRTAGVHFLLLRVAERYIRPISLRMTGGGVSKFREE